MGNGVLVSNGLTLTETEPRSSGISATGRTSPSDLLWCFEGRSVPGARLEEYNDCSMSTP